MYLSSRKNQLAGLSVALLVTTTSAFATDSFISNGFSADSDSAPALPPIMKGADSWSRFREVIKTVEETPEIRALLQKETTHGLSVLQRVSSEGLETTKFQHFYKGLEVMGSMAFHHRNRQNSLIRNKMRSFDLDTVPALSATDATAIAKSIVGDRELIQAPALKILPNENSDSAKLVYWLELEENALDGARQIIIDAHSGNVIGDLSENITIAPIGVYSAKNQGLSLTLIPDATGRKLESCQVLNMATGQTETVGAEACKKLGPGQCQLVLDGDPILVNPEYCTATFTSSGSARPRVSGDVLPRFLNKAFAGMPSTFDQASDNATQNSQKVLGYYLNVHGRDSFDGRGSTSVSVVHAGIQYSNAHWDGRNKRMVYGEGDGAVLGDFTSALDVAGHEMTHGVVSATAKLLNMGESGALNEAYADFFGKMIDFNGDWVVGRKLFLNGGAGKGIRDLANPHNLKARLIGRPYPASMSEKVPSQATCNSSNDNCYVHINATIPGHAGYRVVQAIGKAKAERLYYTVMTQALGPTDTIQSAADDTRKICSQMYDADTCGQVDQAFRQLGM